jgi:hypothetical protein
MKKFILSTVAILFMSAAGVEAMLRLLDPLGFVYFEDLGIFFGNSVDDPSGYTPPIDETHFGRWTLGINEDGARITPDADPSGPTISFYGDSITMCWGVDDDACWVNLVAGELDLNATNYGRNAYNAQNIAALIDRTGQGKCMVFLSFANDLEEPLVFERLRKSNSELPFTVKYLIHYAYLDQARKKPAAPEHPAFDPSMRAILSNPDVLLVAFDSGSYGDLVQSRYGAALIPMFTSRISFADGHASPMGNQQIADAIAPVISDWLKTRSCQ